MTPLRVLTTVWLALIAGVVTYTAIASFLVTSGTIALGVIGAPFMRVAAMASLAAMASALLVRRRLIGSIPPGADPATRFRRYQAATIVGLGLVEAGGLMVITMAMLADAPTWILAGGAACVWMMILARPRASDLER